MWLFKILLKVLPPLWPKKKNKNVLLNPINQLENRKCLCKPKPIKKCNKIEKLFVSILITPGQIFFWLFVFITISFLWLIIFLKSTTSFRVWFSSAWLSSLLVFSSVSCCAPTVWVDRCSLFGCWAQNKSLHSFQINYIHWRLNASF